MADDRRSSSTSVASAATTSASAATTAGSAGRTSDKQPVLEVFVMPTGLPRRRMRVACLTEAQAELAHTEVATGTDPLFDEALKLWEDASGKGEPILLVFSVQAVALPDASGGDGAVEEVLAEARIMSDELRRFGLSNPREGAAVALPLLRDGETLPGALLHCYVHAGYIKRAVARSASTSPVADTAAEHAALPAPDAPRRCVGAEAVAASPVARPPSTMRR